MLSSCYEPQFHNFYKCSVSCIYTSIVYIQESKLQCSTDSFQLPTIITCVLAQSYSFTISSISVKLPVKSEFYCVGAAWSIRGYVRGTHTITLQSVRPFMSVHENDELLRFVCMLYIPLWKEYVKKHSGSIIT
jgi:hypothetical protein